MNPSHKIFGKLLAILMYSYGYNNNNNNNNPSVVGWFVGD